MKSGDVVYGVRAATVYTIRKRIGGDAQGEFFLVKGHGQEFALKWFSHKNEAQHSYWRTRLDNLTQAGAPSPEFIWPIELVESATAPSFGYVMPLFASGLVDLKSYLFSDESMSLPLLVKVCLALVSSFQALHAQGQCYRDFTLVNFSFCRSTGLVHIGGHDAIGSPDEPFAIQGTPGYMAPEVARRECRPSVATDLYSLSLILFMPCIRIHPLLGKRYSDLVMESAPAMEKLLATEPLFVFDPHNQSNAPDPALFMDAIKLWDFYPKFFRDLFVQAFTIGLSKPLERVTEVGWADALHRLRDQMHKCPQCSAWAVYDDEGLQGRICIACNQVLPDPPRLQIADRTVVLSEDTVLYPHHIDRNKQHDFSRVVARLKRHPDRKGLYGLLNESANEWQLRIPGHPPHAVPVGRSAALYQGIEIGFGNTEAKILL